MSLRTPRSRKPLAISFVLTLAALPACETKPAAVPLAEAGDAATTTTATAASSAATVDPPKAEPDAAVAAPTLPPAPNGGTVTKNADGTCWWAPPPSNCPPRIACNPPAPHAVACPK